MSRGVRIRSTPCSLIRRAEYSISLSDIIHTRNQGSLHLRRRRQRGSKVREDRAAECIPALIQSDLPKHVFSMWRKATGPDVLKGFFRVVVP